MQELWHRLIDLLALSEPFMSDDTVAYFFKGREVNAEIEQASTKLVVCCSADYQVVQVQMDAFWRSRKLLHAQRLKRRGDYCLV